MNVLSLFGGIECGRVAFDKAKIKIGKYYSSEVDENAMKIANSNYPDIIQLGDILNWRSWNVDWSEIDILIGGSPCQGFSIAGKKLNFNDQRSALFFVYRDILNHLKGINPNVLFLLENVRMTDDIADAINEELGVKRVFIDSRDFTGLIRKRYYWTNINIKTWEKKSLKLKDIIDGSILYDKNMDFFLDRTDYNPSMSFDGIITINPRDKNGKQTWQRGRVYDIEGNCPTICATLFDLNITKDHKMYRKLTINECERLQGLPKDYTKGISRNERGKCLGNGWTVDVIAHILKSLHSAI